jgi:hypothetical protein
LLSFGLSSQSTGAESSDQAVADQNSNEEIVLALQAEPTNHLHLELQPHELNGLSDHSHDIVAGNDSDHSHVKAGQSSHVGEGQSSVVAAQNI